MEITNNGILYENFVKTTINSVLPNLLEKDDGLGNFNSHEVDLKLNTNFGQTNIEVKGKGSQFGETSFKYDEKMGTFYPAKSHLDKSFVDMVTENALLPIKNFIGDLLEFLRNSHSFQKEITEIPFRVTKQSWVEAKKNGLLIPIAKKIPFTEQLIVNHYNSKCSGCYYMQIEGKGLFYLGKNPLNLPIPEFKGEINVEVRLKRSGSSLVKSINEKVAGVGLIVVGRLTADIRSPYSLDNANHVAELFSSIAT
jgi:hypothetical protein